MSKDAPRNTTSQSYKFTTYNSGALDGEEEVGSSRNTAPFEKNWHHDVGNELYSSLSLKHLTGMNCWIDRVHVAQEMACLVKSLRDFSSLVAVEWCQQSTL